jgi:hypothetical protein
MTSGPPGGWYQDPVGADGVLRYWDGSVWTENVHIPGLPPPPPHWRAVPAALWGSESATPQRPGATHREIGELTRRDLVWETRFVMVAFLVPGIAGAIVLLAQHVSGVGTVTRFPVYVTGHPLTNLIVGILAYLPTACVVPLALFLLNRTGDSPSRLGLGVPQLRMDIIPAFGQIGASFVSELVVLIRLARAIAQSLITSHKHPGRSRSGLLRDLGTHDLGDDCHRRRDPHEWVPHDEVAAVGLDSSKCAHPGNSPSHQLPRLLRDRIHRDRSVRLLHDEIVPEERAAHSGNRCPLPV